MLQPLPAETVYEAQERARRDTRLLLFVLIVLYIVFFNLLAFPAMLFLSPGHLTHAPAHFRKWSAIASALAVLAAWLQYRSAKNVPLDIILNRLGARPADTKDDYHRRFMNVIEEAEAATGIRPIRAVVIPTVGSNAFSAEDGEGNTAIGVTEGVVSRLSRSQLTAVVAHETSHLADGDARLKTLACSMPGVFYTIQGWASVNDCEKYRLHSARLGANARADLFRLAVWFISGTGYILTRCVYMAISRQREHMADAHAVQMCKDPLSMAEALYRISGRYRGGEDIPEGYSALFIINPQFSALDDQQGIIANLFSTHPPSSDRINLMLSWAKADISALKKKQDQAGPAEKLTDRAELVGGLPAAEAPPMYYINRDAEWAGPYAPEQLFAFDFFTPNTWVCPVNSEHVTPASDQTPLLQIFQHGLPAIPPPAASPPDFFCPRCRVQLTETSYEGAEVFTCPFCKGYLLGAAVIERIIVRHDKTFSPNEISGSQQWKKAVEHNASDACAFPEIRCPACHGVMWKVFHSFLIRVVIDRCSNPACRSIWCDTGEIEAIQILVEETSEE